ncbi:MAG: hypothetical protein HKL92_07030 [Candidatus Eremiobacteraeota bacterium]|nr:hypothetical protein [Candidatus Eremiobacteraeota bacterium]NNM93078.1 hypothetical protein [Candidatus Eremiobacteraeota bacterium]
MNPGSIPLGERANGAALDIEILGYRYPDVAEPDGLDLLEIAARLYAPPVESLFNLAVRVREFEILRAYLDRISGGNGPRDVVKLADGLCELTFAPSRRGPVLLGVMLRDVERAHVRVEYLVTLEPHHIGRAVSALDTVLR